MSQPSELPPISRRLSLCQAQLLRAFQLQIFCKVAPMFCHFCQLHCTYFNAPCIHLILCTNWKRRQLYQKKALVTFVNCVLSQNNANHTSNNEEIAKSMQIIHSSVSGHCGSKICFTCLPLSTTNVLIVLQLGRDQKGLKPIRNLALGHLATSHSPIARASLNHLDLVVLSADFFCQFFSSTSNDM